MELIWARLEGRNGHEVGRQLLEKLVGDLPEIAVTDRGKPYFPHCDLHFSISHSKNHAFCAVSRHNLGIDAEEMDRQLEPHLAEKILSPTERARFDGSREMLLRFWVLKESYAKLTGRGWGNYLYQTDFDPADPRIQQIDGCFVAVMEEHDAI